MQEERMREERIEKERIKEEEDEGKTGREERSIRKGIDKGENE